jgi:hypothetical protein
MAYIVPLLDRIPPGILTVIMAVIAGVITMIKIDNHPWLKRTFIIGFILIAALEICVINRSQQINNANSTAIFKSFDKIFERFDNLLKRQEDTYLIISSLELAQKRVTSINVSAQSNHLQLLKYNTAELSRDILTFLADRQVNDPPLPRRETWDKDIQAMVNYTNQTISLYYVRFGSKVIAAYKELKKYKYTDTQLDLFSEHPTNPIGMRIVAEHLGALAEQIPPTNIK